jgi:general secretion pathway protein D
MKNLSDKTSAKKHSLTLISWLISVSILAGCSTVDEQYSVSASRIAAGDKYQAEVSDEAESETTNDAKQVGYETLTALSSANGTSLRLNELSNKLSNSDSVNFSAENMPANQFVHAVFGEILKLNYVVADELSSSEQPVTLNLQRAVSSRELYTLASKILDGQGIQIKSQDGVYFLAPKDGKGKGNQTIGVGRNSASVPQVVGPIMQIVPIKYGINISLERTLADLVNAKVVPDFEKNVLFITAERADILRALDLIELLDLPPSRSKHVGILHLTYVSTEQFIDRISSLLKAEGIPVDSAQSPKSNLVLVPLEQIGAVALFGSDQLYIERVNFWAKQLDQPSEGAEKRYYIFHPKYARARDLGLSIGALISGSQVTASTQGNQSRDTASAFGDQNSTQGVNQQVNGSSRGNTAPAVSSVRNDAVSMTVDERSNTLIFYTSGLEYQTLLPMIKRLDVMPKQILLEATIAEVTLTDELAMGLEFAIKNGKFGASTKGAFGVEKFGGVSLSYIDGLDSLLVQLNQSNTKVNILSSPSLVVRDGVQANMSVGTDVPTIGSTTINPGTETQSTTVEYRKTGVELSVTPTINAQGLVVLQIDQRISNTLEGSTVAGSPSIFERAVTTEVLAQSGQTVMLAGLMSENTTRTKTKVPFLGDFPLIGALFRGEKDSTSKTELIIMITPRVIDQPEQWQSIRQKLDSGMKHLKLQD